MPQLSIVTVYPREGGVGISITETRMKFKRKLCPLEDKRTSSWATAAQDCGDGTE